MSHNMINTAVVSSRYDFPEWWGVPVEPHSLIGVPEQVNGESKPKSMLIKHGYREVTQQRGGDLPAMSFYARTWNTCSVDPYPYIPTETYVPDNISGYGIKMVMVAIGDETKAKWLVETLNEYVVPCPKTLDKYDRAFFVATSTGVRLIRRHANTNVNFHLANHTYSTMTDSFLMSLPILR